MKQHQSKLDYNCITDGIYIGTNQCCQTHFDEALLKGGVTADISLEEKRIDSPFGVTFYMWMPVKDHSPPSAEQFELGTTALSKLAALGKKVYVHCEHGHGRAPTLVAAYLIRSKGMTPQEAEKLIKSKRPSVHLNDLQRKALQTFVKA